MLFGVVEHQVNFQMHKLILRMNVLVGPRSAGARFPYLKDKSPGIKEKQKRVSGQQEKTIRKPFFVNDPDLSSTVGRSSNRLPNLYAHSRPSLWQGSPGKQPHSGTEVGKLRLFV
jgi:hypothetical protein